MIYANITPNYFKLLYFIVKFNMPNVGDKITVNITTEASVPAAVAK
ncbi:hypothetical protein [Acinetobacter sp. Marseille-Q1623]|nr:hypothetical protein [Acinetobacter sp. Marseille-Q1623]